MTGRIVAFGSFMSSRSNAATAPRWETPCAGCCFPPFRGRRSPSSPWRGCCTSSPPSPGWSRDTTELAAQPEGAGDQGAGGPRREASWRRRGEGPRILRIRAGRSRGGVGGRTVETPGDVEIVNKDLHIATLTARRRRSTLQMRWSGDGATSRRMKHDTFRRRPIGAIPVDSISRRCENVGFRVEPTRVGHMTDFDPADPGGHDTMGRLTRPTPSATPPKIPGPLPDLVLRLPASRRGLAGAPEIESSLARASFQTRWKTWTLGAPLSNACAREVLHTVAELVRRTEERPDGGPQLGREVAPGGKG